MAKIPMSPQRIVINNANAIQTAALNNPLMAATSGFMQGYDLEGKLAEEERKQEQLRLAQQQTDLTRRGADFQTRAYDIIQQNREQFKNNPDASYDSLNEQLMNLSDELGAGLEPLAMETFKRSQINTMAQYGLQQKQWATSQLQKNVQTNLGETSKILLSNAASAGSAADYEYLFNLAKDVESFNATASSVYDVGVAGEMTNKLKTGMVESFTDALMYSNPLELEQRLNDGTFDDLLSKEQIEEKKTEVMKFRKSQDDYADYKRTRGFIDGNAEIAEGLSSGRFTFNQIDKELGAGKITPEYAEIVRERLLAGETNAKTDPVLHGDYMSKVDRLVTNYTSTTRQKDGDTTTTITESAKEIRQGFLEDALLLQYDIQRDVVAGRISGKDADSIMKNIQAAIQSTMAVGGGEEFMRNNHYQKAWGTFTSPELALTPQEQLDAMRLYSAGLRETRLNDAYFAQIEEQADQDLGLGSRLMGSIGVGKVNEKREAMEQIDNVAKELARDAYRKVLEKRNPALARFQGKDIPNYMLTEKGVENGLEGGNVTGEANIQVTTPFEIKRGQDGFDYKIYQDGTYERLPK